MGEIVCFVTHRCIMHISEFCTPALLIYGMMTGVIWPLHNMVASECITRQHNDCSVNARIALPVARRNQLDMFARRDRSKTSSSHQRMRHWVTHLCTRYPSTGCARHRLRLVHKWKGPIGRIAASSIVIYQRMPSQAPLHG